MTTEWKGQRYWKNRPLDERLKNLKIPKRYENLTLASYDKSIGDIDVHYAVTTWLKNAEQNITDGTGLYLFGGTGVGKTHLAISLLKEAVTNNQCSGFFIPVTNYIEMMYDEMHNDGELPEEYSSAYLAKYIRTVYDIVVLDGLGDENDSEFTRRSIMTLLTQRVNGQLPTIVTSLYNPKKLAVRYGERFVSILQSVCRLVPVAGTDQRNAGK
jgi:DNA replication protein DnaC